MSCPSDVTAAVGVDALCQVSDILLYCLVMIDRVKFIHAEILGDRALYMQRSESCNGRVVQGRCDISCFNQLHAFM